MICAGPCTSKSQPIFAGTYAEIPGKRAPHAIGASKATTDRDLLQRPACVLELQSRGVQPSCVDKFGGRHVHFLAEDTGEIPNTHAGLFREVIDGQLRRKIVQDVLLNLLDLGFAGHLRGEMSTELGLTARALQEHDHVARHDQGQLSSVILFDKSECQIHARGYAGRRA